MNTTPCIESYTDTHRRAKQCAALTGTVRDSLGGEAVDARDAELMHLATELSASVYQDLLYAPRGLGDDGKAYALAGKLTSTLEAMGYVNRQVPHAVDEDEQLRLVGRVAWLQSAADDFARELVSLLAALCATEASA